MAHKALIALNVILDYLLQREENGHESLYESARYIMEEVFEGRLKGFLPASAAPILAYLLGREAKKHPSKDIDWKAALKIVLSHLHLVSVTGDDALEALENNDIEDALMVEALERVCPDAIVISRDKKFPGPFKTFNSVEFVEYYKASPVPTGSLRGLIESQLKFHFLTSRKGISITVMRYFNHGSSLFQSRSSLFQSRLIVVSITVIVVSIKVWWYFNQGLVVFQSRFGGVSIKVWWRFNHGLVAFQSRSDFSFSFIYAVLR